MADAAPCAALAAAAAAVMARAHAPYSRRRSGAALRLSDGRVVTGAAVENAAFVHGYSALESAMAVMIAGGAAAAGLRIREIHVCWDAVPDYAAGWPDRAGWGLAMLCAAPEWRAALSWPGGGVADFDGRRYGFYAGGAPGPAVSGDADAPCGIPDDGAGPGKGSGMSHDGAGAVPREEDPVGLWRARAAAQAEGPVPDFLAEGALRGLYEARRNAFAPVSDYLVGAMAESACGRVFYGCNIEEGGNKALHAEGGALAAMVSALGPAAKLARMTVLTAGRPGFPCGGCRQHMLEFAMAETEIVLLNLAGERRAARFADLLPFSFGNADLESASAGRR